MTSVVSRLFVPCPVTFRSFSCVFIMFSCMLHCSFCFLGPLLAGLLHVWAAVELPLVQAVHAFAIFILFFCYSSLFSLFFFNLLFVLLLFFAAEAAISRPTPRPRSVSGGGGEPGMLDRLNKAAVI